jgi:type VI secretion system protein ImpM
VECDGQAPGFFGKLPSHGDFVGRRLPPEVRDCFDSWLQAALLRSKADLGETWLPAWMNSPLWRFVVGEGVCGAQAWTGVMMPSHDRVGRCFPLLLAAPVDGTPSLRQCLTLHAGWFARLEHLALSSLEDGFVLESLDVVLLATAGAPQPVRPAATDGTLAQAGSPQMVEFAGSGSFALAEEILRGRSAWWADASAHGSPCLAVSAGLPPPDMFAPFLDGRWNARGWRQV